MRFERENYFLQSSDDKAEFFQLKGMYEVFSYTKKKYATVLINQQNVITRLLKTIPKTIHLSTY